MDLLPDKLPVFPAGEIVEAIAGVVIPDPYRALEEESPEAHAWQEAQSSAAKRHLRRGPFADIKASVLDYMRAASLQAPKYTAAGWFRLPPESDGSSLILSEELVGAGITLRAGARDPEDRNDPTFAWFEPSPDGRFIAYGAPEGGGLQGGAQLVRLRIFDRQSAQDLPVRVAHVTASIAWLPDSTGFYAVRGVDTASKNPERRIVFQSLIGAHELREEPLRGLGFEARLKLSPDGRYLSVRTGAREPRADWLLDRTIGKWIPFLLHVPATCFGEFHADRMIALTTWGSPRGRIVSIPIATSGDVTTWRDIVPESDGIVRSLAVLGDEVVVTEFTETGTRLRVAAIDGTSSFFVPIPADCSVSIVGAIGWFQSLGTPAISPGPDGFAFIASSYSRSPGLYWFDLKTRTLGTAVEPVMELQNLTIRREFFTGADGVAIPATIVTNGKSTKAAPTVIFSYGAYNFATIPSWIGTLGPFVSSGGTVVFAHVRGGGERGIEWWRVGHHQHRQKAYDDIHTVAEGLIAAGHTTSDQLGLLGLSNGGTNVCTAITQRPDLYRAGVSLAPQCDLIRYNRDPFSGGVATTGHHQGLHVNSGTWRNSDWMRENAADEGNLGLHLPQAMYPDPMRYSPYHLARNGTSYPALLLVCGTEDVWCPAWHSRKMAARLQAATSSENPILLRVWDGAGHDHPVSDPDQIAEWLSFLIQELGFDRVANSASAE